MRAVVLYTKPGCHLCEEVLALLRELRGEFQFTLDEVDITRDEALHKKYFDQIPVLLIDDRTPLAAPIRKEDVRAALRL